MPTTNHQEEEIMKEFDCEHTDLSGGVSSTAEDIKTFILQKTLPKKQVKEKLLKAELKGVGKILDILYDNSYNAMGKEASERIEEEMIYYFGENWSKDMYDFIEEGNREIKPVKTLKELTNPKD